MKLKVIAVVSAILVAGSIAAWPSVVHWRENTRQPVIFKDLPQAERSLRVPTQESLQVTFPSGSKRILEHSQQLILFSLEPTEDYDTTNSLFHRHGVLGKTVITDSVSKTALLASLYDGLVSPPPRADGLKQIGMGCFMPRHGIRAIQNGKTVDLLICFSCRAIEVYLNGQKISKRAMNDAPRPTFDQILTKAHIPLSG